MLTKEKEKVLSGFLSAKNDYKKYIYEVKANERTEDEQNIIKFQVGRKYCLENNMKYVVVTEEDIRQGYLIENLDVLAEVREDSTNRRVMNEILHKIIQLGEKSTIHELKLACGEIDEAEFECNLYYLLYKHELYADLINNLINDELTIERK